MRKLLLLFCVICVASCRKDNNGTNNNSTELPNSYSNQSVGASAHDLLSADKYSSVVIEVQYMQGYQPDAAALNNLKLFAEKYCNKPGGVTITTEAIDGKGGVALTLAEIKEIEKTNRTAYTAGSQLAIYVLVTDGQYSEPRVLGVAYRNTSICLMGKTIFDNSGGIGQANRVSLETTVLDHELGHLLGLVNIGTPMQTNHKDDAHGSHCTDQDCLMYYASETTDVLGLLLTSPVPDLDANCHADLVANGGKP